MADEEERYAAMIEFLGCFPSLSGPPPSEMAELGDGVIMFEALSEISPDYFDPSTISRDLGDNWALKSSNLRKLLRNLETYYHDVLHKDADFEEMATSISGIARNSELAPIATFVELITAAACTCEDRGTYVGWIMNMSDTNQSHMKVVIESSLGQIMDYAEGGDESNDESDNDDGGDMDDFLSDDEEDSFEGGAKMTALFRNTMQNIDAVTNDMDSGSIDAGQSPTAHTAAVLKERNELRVTVEETKRQFAALKSQSARYAEDTESSQNRASALSQDLQERLEMRQDELNDVEEELTKTKRKMVDAEERALDLDEKNATLADELDVATAKAAQLRKSEATVIAYRKKLEGVGVMNQQMTDLEDTAAGYLKQIMDLEMETKKVPELQKSLEKVKRTLDRVDKLSEEAQDTLKTKNAEVSKLKSDLSASIMSKKNCEDELHDLRIAVEGPDAADIDNLGSGMGDLALSSIQSIPQLREKAMRLEIENKALTEKLSVAEIANKKAMKKMKDEAVELRDELNNKSIEGTTSDTPENVSQLQDEIKKKTSELKKLATDKDRLETYTKRTLAKFQEKYLVALQECKAKLKEKHDKIETLEKRSAAEKSTQKREEKLLSATIYELGLSIMQQNLKKT